MHKRKLGVRDRLLIGCRSVRKLSPRSGSTRRFTLNMITSCDLSYKQLCKLDTRSSPVPRFPSDFDSRVWRFYEEMILTCLSLVMSDVNRDLVSGTAGARRVHVHGETIVASAQRGRGNRQAGTHACAGGWRDKKRDREERERERNEKKKRERERH